MPTWKSYSLQREGTLQLDFTIPTEALLRLYSYRSVDGSLVHLRLRENLYSLFARSCCLNTNLDTWLVLLIQQQLLLLQPLTSLLLVLSFFQGGQLAAGGSRGAEDKEEEFLPDAAGMLNCPFGSRSPHSTHVSLWSRIHKSTPSQVLWANSWIPEKAALG